MQQIEWQYVSLVRKILSSGERTEGRNGVTKSIFGATLDIDNLDTFFPLLMGRKIYYKGVLGELAAFLNKPQKLADFESRGCNYWSKWADENGDLKVDYGNAWTDWNGINQLDELRDKLVNNPNDRRLIVSGWRPDKLEDLSLPCCHLLYQWHVSNDGKLNMIWYQRSADTMIGIPSDIVLAAAWNILLANEVGLKPGNIKMVFGDTHIYEEHYHAARAYIKQTTCNSALCNPKRPPTYSLNLAKGTKIEDFMPDDLEIIDYEPCYPIKFELKA